MSKQNDAGACKRSIYADIIGAVGVGTKCHKDAQTTCSCTCAGEDKRPLMAPVIFVAVLLFFIAAGVLDYFFLWHLWITVTRTLILGSFILAFVLSVAVLVTILSYCRMQTFDQILRNGCQTIFDMARSRYE